MRTEYQSIRVTTQPGISLHDITPSIEQRVKAGGITVGFTVVTSPHTTTAVIVNEHEPRLLEDIRNFLERLVPKEAGYLHNDIHLRDCPPDEPENAHSHIAAILLGNSAVIPIEDGRPILGTWQSVMLVELDGPRERSINLRIFGA